VGGQRVCFPIAAAVKVEPPVKHVPVRIAITHTTPLYKTDEMLLSPLQLLQRVEGRWLIKSRREQTGNRVRKAVV
jgi:hypothetical protein